MKVISVKGFVISSSEYKESSKILNIITKEYGIIGVISKGCKSIKSKLRVVSEKLTYATFHMYYKEDGLSTLIGGDIIDYFPNTKSDIKKIGYLTYLSELMSNVYKQSEEDEVFDMFIEAINKIESGLDPKIISNILELQYLNYLGINLNLDECSKCGSKKVITFSSSKGGYVCSKCRTNEEILDETVIKMLRLYYYVDISKISNLDIDSNVSDKINDILDNYYDEYSGVYMKSKKFLKDL